jgi:uncharacterized membrane protein YbaN (DUF454 family)
MNQGRPGSAKHPVWRAVKIALGAVLLPLGIIGLFLPLLQGVLFLLVGVALLASEVPFVARFRDRIRSRYPGPWDKAEELGERVKAWFRARGADR